MIDIIKEIQNLNSENYQEFISKYGKIQDVELAKSSLVLNPNVWNVLHEDLKQMGEVISHYIPVGYYSDTIYIDSCGCDSTSTGIYYPWSGDIYIPVGFKFVNRFADYKNNLVPDIDFPSDFSEEKYLEILRNIPVQEKYCFSDLDAQFISENKLQNCEMYSVYGTTPASVEKSKNVKLPGDGPDRIDRKSIIFDRTKIKDVVANIYNNNQLSK